MDGRRMVLGLAVLVAERLGGFPGDAAHLGLGAACGLRAGSPLVAARAVATGHAHDLAEGARRRGAALAERSRDDARTFLHERVDDGLAWFERRILPQLVEAMIPLLRDRVLPTLVDDLTHDPQLRTLVLEQGRGVVSHAADELRDATAEADDRVEAAFHHLVRRP